MSNYCNYYMRVVGADKSNIEEFIKIMKAYYNYHDMKFSAERHFFRIFDAFNSGDIYKTNDGLYEAFIDGSCAWSVKSCMTADGYYNDMKDVDGFRGTTLKEESDILNLQIEVFSEEEGIGFCEHYLYCDGKEYIDDCDDLILICPNQYSSVDELNIDNGTSFDEYEFLDAKNDDICLKCYPDGYMQWCDDIYLKIEKQCILNNVGVSDDRLKLFLND